MARIAQSPLAFPPFAGATRRLVLVNLVAFFVLLVAGFALPQQAGTAAAWLSLLPNAFLHHGALWQPLTYSFIHPSLVSTLFELLSLWFLASFLEAFHGSGWVTGLYTASILGTAATAILIIFFSERFGVDMAQASLTGCFGAVFGMLIAIGVLHGDTEFLMFFVIGIKARYLAIIYALIAFAMLFSQSRLIAISQLGGALAGLIYLRFAGSTSGKRGIGFKLSEQWYGLRNRYYRWKRRRAGRKFEVYMKKQGRTVRLDSRGRQLDDEDHDNPSRWN